MTLPELYREGLTQRARSGAEQLNVYKLGLVEAILKEAARREDGEEAAAVRAALQTALEVVRWEVRPDRRREAGRSASVAADNRCPLCVELTALEAGDDPWAVARLETGYVRLNPNQYFTGATFFVAKRCVAELHQLDRPERDRHLIEMAEVAGAVFSSAAARKLNYEALGNSVPHLHWWLTPRRAGDKHPELPIWADPGFTTPPASRWHPAPAERDDLRRRLLAELRQRDVVIERAYV